jgi:hypothetical protein
MACFFDVTVTGYSLSVILDNNPVRINILYRHAGAKHPVPNVSGALITKN